MSPHLGNIECVSIRGKCPSIKKKALLPEKAARCTPRLPPLATEHQSIFGKEALPAQLPDNQICQIVICQESFSNRY